MIAFIATSVLIDSLLSPFLYNRERDELTSQLAVMRSQYERMKQKADDDYQQIKRAVEMVEQAQLEQTQVNWRGGGIGRGNETIWFVFCVYK